MKNLEPKKLWENFHSLTQIPRPSGKKEEVSAFLANYGRSLGLETIVDEMGNVLIRKPASPGMENHPGVILQAHMDMVPQKEADKVFDFHKDAIQAYVEDNGEWVTADGTTLGADNGIGVSAALAILADKNAVHPPLEAFFTVDEETGMFGAFGLKGGLLQGRKLLNLDSETEGELYVGCAGGIDIEAVFDFEPVEVEAGDIAMRVQVGGCKGGHSGIDIHLQRANAIKLLARFLKMAVSELEARLCSINGGNMRNAIPRSAEAVITIPAESKDDFMQAVDDFEDMLLKQYAGVEDKLFLRAEETECPKTQIPEDVQDYMIHALTLCPHGVYRFMEQMPDVVETSNNLAIVQTEGNKVSAFCLCRSAVQTRKRELLSVIHSAFSLAGAEVKWTGDYPGWQPNLQSQLLTTMKDIYHKEFGNEPRIVVIHAGLECGIIARNYPGMEMISFGPTVEHPHSPEERVNIATVQKFYRFIFAALRQL